jgi:hypothetical protein
MFITSYEIEEGGFKDEMRDIVLQILMIHTHE